MSDSFEDGPHATGLPAADEPAGPHEVGRVQVEQRPPQMGGEQPADFLDEREILRVTYQGDERCQLGQ